MPTQKIDPKVIFASDAPAIDKPPVFSDKTKGWDVARANDGRPQIKEMNKVQQDTDLKILWLNENAVLPYDETIDYPDGAVTLKDGSFKQLSSGSWVEFLDDFADKDAVKRGIANRYDSSLTYNSGERVVLTNGDIVKSTIDGNTNDPNVDMTGWVYESQIIITNDYTTLAALSVKDGAIAFVKTSGISGEFVYKSASTATTNGGTIIASNQGGRWLRVYNGAVNVKWFFTGSVAFTDALKSAVTLGFNVYIPKGSYSLTSSVSLSAAQKVFGDGRESTVITVTDGFDAFDLAGEYSCVEDFTIRSETHRTSGISVKLSEATRGNSIKRLRMQNQYRGIHIQNESVITALEDIEILNTTPSTGIGILIEGGNDTFLHRVVMDADPNNQPLAGVQINRSQATWMTDCDIIHHGDNLSITPDGSSNGYITWCFFSNVACDLGSGDGIVVAPKNNAIVKGLFFNNCWTSSNKRGIHVNSDAGVVDGVFFTAHTGFNNRQQGAFVESGNNIVFDAGSRFAGNSQEIVGSYAGIEFKDNVRNFAVKTSRVGAVAGFTVTQSYGIKIGSNCDNYVILGNNVEGNTVAIVDNSFSTSITRNVESNQGYKTLARGVASIASGQTEVTINHGLASTPTKIIVSPYDTNLAGTSYWSGSATSTTCKINIDVAQAASASFCWEAVLY